MQGKFTKMMIMIITSALLASCEEPLPIPESCTLPQQESAQLAEAGTDEETPPPRECLIPAKAERANLDLNVNLTDFNSEQEAKMRDALDRLKIVINSEEFKQKVLNHEYDGEQIFYDNAGMNNQEIYETIMLGAETLNPAENEVIDINITLYYSNNSTVGYTYPNVDRIWVNDKFFSGFSLGKVAANVVHEWTHKVGFEHDFSRTTEREFSVPYGIGTIVQELVDNM